MGSRSLWLTAGDLGTGRISDGLPEEPVMLTDNGEERCVVCEPVAALANGLSRPVETTDAIRSGIEAEPVTGPVTVSDGLYRLAEKAMQLIEFDTLLSEDIEAA